MHKVVILIEELEDWPQFETQWPSFLHLAEAMPGIQQEATSRVEHLLYGGCRVGQVHELFFNSLGEAESAMASPQGLAAGRLLQQITGGRITIFFADHKQDAIANIQKFRQSSGQADERVD